MKCAETCPNPCYKERDASVEMRYVTCVLRSMADRFFSELIPPSRIRVRLYGGASLFKGITAGISVGEKNVAAARATLSSLGLRIAEQETGGEVGRTVVYDSVTDRVEVRSPSLEDKTTSLNVRIPV